MLYGQLKTAGYFGRLAQMEVTPAQASISNAPMTEGLLAKGQEALTHTVLKNTPTDVLIPSLYGSMLGGTTLANMLNRRVALGGTEEERKDTLDRTNAEIANRSTLDQVGHNMQKAVIPGMLGGAALSAFMDPAELFGHHSASPLARVLTGALGGGLGAAVGRGLVGGISKLVNNYTSQDSKDRANAMVAKHPYLTSLPLGSTIGAMLA
jgi:hypothetical protein